MTDYTRPYMHGSTRTGPDVWTAIPNTDTTPQQRRQAVAFMQGAAGRGLVTADELATYYRMLFNDQELEEMDL